ncbi:MAG: 23S rRNA (pseudouridine(1915)-N(3))-methyltransferase RlmH [Vulcanimicrobiaceae bacterium]
MKYRIISVGRIREQYVLAALADFRVRFERYERIEEVEVAQSHGTDPDRAIREEGDRIIRALVPDEPVWLLERTGTAISSIGLSERLTALSTAGTARITFAIAGTYGASDALRARANFTWALSELTFLHEWAKMLVMEQLYRAAKIVRNEPYHH